MITKSSGFSLIELLVVVAIIGILSAVGTVAYNGYVKGTKKSSAKNIMQQISLAQTEEYSNSGDYYRTTESDNCDPDKDSSKEIEDNLFGGGEQISEEVGYEMCIAKGDSGFLITALGGSCQITLSQVGTWEYTGC